MIMPKDVVNITDGAKKYINQRCDGLSTIVGIRINGKGCSGHAYEYFLVDPEKVSPMDEKILWPGGGLVISATSLMYMIGSTLDVKSTAMEEHLYWENPNAVNHCGCGESFSIKG